MSRISELEDRLGYRFRRPDLLVMATTHKSVLGDLFLPGTRVKVEGKNLKKYSYETLEFLGDRVVNLVMADLIHRDTPERGQQTRDWAQKTLKFNPNQERVARRLHLQEHVENRTTPPPEKLLSDALEAILGAMYLDSGGLEVPYAAAAFWFEPELAAIRRGPPFFPLALPDRVRMEMAQRRKRGKAPGFTTEAQRTQSTLPSSLKPQASSLKPLQRESA